MEEKNQDNPAAIEICKQVMKPDWDRDVLKIRKSLPIKLARQVKEWRVGGTPGAGTYSWRSIATLFVEKYPEVSEHLFIISGNQISGMYLCEAAMLKLKETVDQGWN